MKVQAKQGDRSVFDLDANVARALIASGTHVEYKPVEPVRVPNTTWATGWIPAQLGIPREPVITATCTTCSGAQRMTGPTAHKTQKFLHCGVTESVPRHIAAQYAGMRQAMANEQEARAKKAQVEAPSFIKIF